MIISISLDEKCSRYRRLVRDLGLFLVAAPKLDPDPNAAPEPKGVENNEVPAAAEAGALPPNKEGVEADVNIDGDEEGKSDD